MTLLANLKKILAEVAHFLSPDCGEAARLQSQGSDQSLPRLQRIGLRIHLLLCKWCRRYGKQIRFLRRAAHEHSEELTEARSRTLSPEARERLKRSLSNEAE